MRDRGRGGTLVAMGFIILTLIVLVIIASVVAQDFSVFSWAYWQEGDTSTSRSEVFRNVGLFFVAVIALGFGIWRAWTAHRQAEASQRQAEAANEQARIAQQGQITERFSTAVEHLGSEQLPVRLGGNAGKRPQASLNAASKRRTSRSSQSS